LLTRYLEKRETAFHQSYSDDEFWDSNERIGFRGQKVKDQYHGGINYARNMIKIGSYTLTEVIIVKIQENGCPFWNTLWHTPHVQCLQDIKTPDIGPIAVVSGD